MLADSNCIPTRTLAGTPDGSTVLIVGIKPGSRERLESLGLVPGVSLRRLSASPHKGPIVVERSGSGFALAYSLAEAILVEPAAR